MPKYPLAFVRCVDCGHVYNSEFDYGVVPYSDKPNLMFNKGVVWNRHLELVRKLILDRLPERPTVVEIGCGDGGFLRTLASVKPAGRYIGFDLNTTTDSADSQIETYRCLFEPDEHLAEFRPDLIISRHVLEHLMNPLGFVQALSFAASWHDVDTRLFIEVPCIDRVLTTARTVDFYYEHNSNFTTGSLQRLLQRSATTVELVQRGFNEEVVYGLARFTRQQGQIAIAHEAMAFRSEAIESRRSVQQALQTLADSGKTIAIWGGTGKAAAFINQYGLKPQQFPLVVDSDPEKAGTHVPGMGQEIRFRDYLVDHPVDIILIATQWRTPDIAEEIELCSITCEQILLEHCGRLVDYLRDEHPYRAT